LRRKRQKARRGGTEKTVGDDRQGAAGDEGALKGSSMGIDKRTV